MSGLELLPLNTLTIHTFVLHGHYMGVFSGFDGHNNSSKLTYLPVFGSIYLDVCPLFFRPLPSECTMRHNVTKYIAALYN